MLEFIFYIVAGAGVGLAVGLTGVGGGSLMTPLLILAGIPDKIAIGTDLLYASATKTGAMYSHNKQGTIQWNLVILLALGSIPASLLTSVVLKYYIPDSFDYGPTLTHVLGYMLILTAVVVFFKNRITKNSESDNAFALFVSAHAYSMTFFSGLILGVFVTLSSVGAGAFCAALLMVLFPRMPALRVVGTDIAHAVPLTFIAGLGHLWNGNVDFYLLAGLLIGSLPAAQFGARMATKIPNSILQPILAVLLLVIGVKFAFFGAAH